MKFFLSVGSNIDPQKNIPLSIETLKKNFQVLNISSVYETDPVGSDGTINTRIAAGQKFWNYAAVIEFNESRMKLSHQIRDLENFLGRVRDPQNKFAPRCIDFDILPQADYQKQAFIMIPLAEIAAQEKDAETGKTFKDLSENFTAEKKSYRKIG